MSPLFKTDSIFTELFMLSMFSVRALLPSKEVSITICDLKEAANRNANMINKVRMQKFMLMNSEFQDNKIMHKRRN